MEDNKVGKFGSWDYVVFCLMLSVSSGIGIYHAWRARKKQSNREFLMGGQTLGPFPVAMSLLASFQSAVTVLGIPSQMYAYGTQHWAVVISAVIAVLITDRIFLPMFFQINVTSVNEYLDKRFQSKAVRLIASLSFILSTVFYLGTVLYGPALALNSVTPLTVEASVVTIGLVCTFYTTIGGMKAVVWTDVLQMFVMVAGLLMIIIKGVILVGGFEKVWKINQEWGRIQFVNVSKSVYSPIPTVWEVILSFGVIWGADYAISQTQVQRYYSTSSLKNARRALYINLPALVVMLSLGCLSGVVIFAYYHDCDPLLLHSGISRLDQLVPYFVMDTLSYIPGLAGLFVSCVFSGSLSTLSSGFNALSAVTWEDFLCHLPFPKSGKYEVWITKGIACIFGIVTIGFAFLSARIPSILQAAIGLSGAIMGPLLGVFLMGAVCPFVNGWGALVGLVAGESVCLWIIVGSLTFKRTTPRLPTSTQCLQTLYENGNVTFAEFFPNATLVLPPPPGVDRGYLDAQTPEGLLQLYHLSSYLIPVICFVVTVTVGITVALLTNWKQKPMVSREVLSQVLHNKCCLCCLPHTLRDFNENNSTNDLKFVPVPVDHNYEMSNQQYVDDEEKTTNGHLSHRRGSSERL